MQSPYRSMRVQVIIGRPERFGLCRSRPYRRTKEKWNIRHLLTGSFDGDQTAITTTIFGRCGSTEPHSISVISYGQSTFCERQFG